MLLLLFYSTNVQNVPMAQCEFCILELISRLVFVLWRYKNIFSQLMFANVLQVLEELYDK